MSSPFDLPLTCYSAAGFLATGFDFVELTKHPIVAERWREPSALEGMSVGAVAAHGLGNMEHILSDCERPEPATALMIGTVGYTRAARLDRREDLKRIPGHDMLIRHAEENAADGPEPVIARAEHLLEQLRWMLPAMDPAKHVYVMRLPPMMSTLAMMVANRTNELICHMDDLAVSVGLPTPPIRPDAAAMAITLLASVARKVNGDLEVIRAMARGERAKADAVRGM